jgi:TonB family protein
VTWIDHLWQSSLFGLAILGLLEAARPLSARLRRTLAWIGLLKFAVPAALFTPVIRALDPTAAAAHWLAPNALPWLILPFAHPGPPGAAGRPTAAIFWLSGAVLAGAISFGRAWRLRRRLLADAGPASEAVRRSLARAAALAGLARPPPALAVGAEDGPGVLGFRRPVVVVPQGLESSLSAAELDAVLVHECVHVARRDNAWSLLQISLVALNWFNPVIWLLSRRIDGETEMSCDERVLDIVADNQNYLTGLAKTARHTLGLLHAGFAPAGLTPVGERLRNIRRFHRRSRPAWIATVLVGGAASAAVLSGYAGSVTRYRDPGPAGGADLVPPAPAAGLLVNLVPGSYEGTEPADLDRAPSELSGVAPAYPDEMRLAGISGDVVVDFTVDATGRVVDPRPQAYSRPQFAAAAVAALRQWRFMPGLRKGSPIPAHLHLRFGFSAATGEVSARSD